MAKILLKAEDVKGKYLPNASEMENLVLKETAFKVSGDGVFHTIQGEGTMLGVPTTFIRLHYCNLSCRFCVPMGTKISLADGGLVDVSMVQPGDKVFSYNTESNDVEEDTVTELMKRETDELYIVELADGTKMQLTGNHEVYTDRGRVMASDLVSTDTLHTM